MENLEKNEKTEGLEEINVRKRKAPVKNETKPPKGRGEHENEVNFPCHSDNALKKGEVKEREEVDKSPVRKKQKRKDNAENNEKQVAPKKEKAGKKEKKKGKDKKEKAKTIEGKSGSKGKVSQGLSQITTKSEKKRKRKGKKYDLNVDSFIICKEIMRPVKKALHLLDKPNERLPMDKQVDHMRRCLLTIGDHISESMKEFFEEEEDVKKWERNLWIFVAKFTYFDGTKLHKMYNMSAKRRSRHKEAKTSESKSGSKGKQSKAPIHITPKSNSTPIGKEIHDNMNQETINKCIERIWPIKKALKQLQKPVKGWSVEEQMEHMGSSLLEIGDHILTCSKDFPDLESIKLHRRNLWIVVSKFTKFDVRKLHKMFVAAYKKRSQDNEQEQQKEQQEQQEQQKEQQEQQEQQKEEAAAAAAAAAEEEAKKPLQMEPSEPSGEPSVPQAIRGPHPQKPHPHPPHSPQMQRRQWENDHHPRRRHFSNSDQGKWQRDRRFSYGGGANQMWEGERHHQYEPHWYKEHHYGDRWRDWDPHYSSGNYWMNNQSRKRPYEPYYSERDHQGHRDYYDRYHYDSKRRRTDDSRSQSYYQQDFRWMYDYQPSVGYHGEGPSDQANGYRLRKVM